MAKTKENLKGMKADELKNTITTLKESLRVIRFKAEGSKSKNVKEAAAIKKQIARAMTELNKNKSK